MVQNYQIMGKLSSFTIFLAILWVVTTELLPTQYYTGKVTITNNGANFRQKVPRIKQRTVLLTLTEALYNGYFSLSITDSIAELYQNQDEISINATVKSIAREPNYIKLVLQFTILKEPPFMQTLRMNLTYNEKSKMMTSLKKIQNLNKTISVAAFCIGFSSSNTTTETYYFSKNESVDYQFFSLAKFNTGDWLTLLVVIMNENYPEAIGCSGSYLTSIQKFTYQKIGFLLDKVPGVEFIVGLESLLLDAGGIRYNSDSGVIQPVGYKGVFDVAAIALVVSCQKTVVQPAPKSLPPSPPPRPKAKAQFETVLFILTIVFGSLFIVLLFYEEDQQEQVRQR